ncbi:hypothetical protein [Alteromonas sp. 009811495]|uniref:hypothetical protein n=1 Tax=Alteromonas sp. 009811495 TaxID=3002962 RepID=UPI00237DC534|nr:hypothetical protein [Alteromonas sp. 009811495]WDT85131.1 hypothetical protein OZ660_14460 [Alteromonas sp. 009811495]
MEKESQLEIFRNLRATNWLLVSISILLLVAISNYGLARFVGLEKELEFFGKIAGRDFSDLTEDIIQATLSTSQNRGHEEKISASQRFYITHSPLDNFLEFEIKIEPEGIRKPSARFDNTLFQGQFTGYFPQVLCDKTDEYDLPRDGIVNTVGDIQTYWDISAKLEKYALVHGFDKDKAILRRGEIIDAGTVEVESQLSHTVVIEHVTVTNEEVEELKFASIETRAWSGGNLVYDDNFSTRLTCWDDGTAALIVRSKWDKIYYELEIPFDVIEFEVVPLTSVFLIPEKYGLLFEDAFPVVMSDAEAFPELNIHSLDVFFNQAKRNSSKTSSLFGFELSPTLLLDLGVLIICIVQLYFFIHLNHFADIIRDSQDKRQYLWIGLYNDIISRGLFFVTSIGLPITASMMAINMQLTLNSNEFLIGINVAFLALNFVWIWSLYKLWTK